MKPGKTSRPSCWATSRRTGSNAAPCSLSSSRADLPRGLQDLHHGGDDPRGLVRGVPGDELAHLLEALLVVTPARRRGPAARRSRRSRRPRAPPAGTACGASISTSWAALPSLEPWYWRSGDGIVSASSLRVPARMFSACASALSSARSADRLALVDQRRVRARRSGRCRAARRPSGSSRTSSSSGRCARASWSRRASARAQRRPDLLAQRGEILPRGDDLALLVLDRERHLQVRRAGGRGPRRPAGSARRAGPRSRPRAPPAAARCAAAGA